MGPLDLDHPDDREADQERVEKFVAGIEAVLSRGETLPAQGRKRHVGARGGESVARREPRVVSQRGNRRGHQRAQVGRAGVAGRRSAQGRVHRDARARVAQSAGANADRRRAAASSGSGTDKVVSRCDRKTVEASDTARRRFAGHLADHEQQARDSQGADPAGRRFTGCRRIDQAPSRAMRSAIDRDAPGRAAVCGRRSRPSRAGVLQSAVQRREVHRRARESFV